MSSGPSLTPARQRWWQNAAEAAVKDLIDTLVRYSSK
jgi:hypothetical protein